MRINLISPVYKLAPHGNDSRLVWWLNQPKVKEDLNIDLHITDLRSYPFRHYDWSKKYDATFVIKGEMLPPDYIKQCSQPRFLYFPDDILAYPVYGNLIEIIGPYYDKVYTFDKYSIDEYHRRGCRDVKYLPPWTGIDLFNDKGKERDIDVCFIGSINEERKNMLVTVRDRFSDRVTCFETDIYGHRYVDLLNRSKIVLNLGQSKNSGVSQRVLEASACGALVITNNCKGLSLMFNVGEEVIGWDNFNDLLNKIDFYLKHDRERKAIAKLGYTKTVWSHLVGNRFKVILEDIEKWKAEVVNNTKVIGGIND